jgi:hypothetical protein
MDTIRSYTSLNALGLSVTGRPSINLLSTLLGAISQNISDSSSSGVNGTSTVSNSTLSTNVSLALTTSDTTFGLSARLFSPLAASFSVYIPGMLFIVRENSATGDGMISISTSEVDVPAGASLIMQIAATVNMTQADPLGITLDSFIDGEYITIDVTGDSITNAKQSSLPANVDINVAFTYDTLMGFINSTSSSGSSSDSSSSTSYVHSFHVEPLSLLYNTSYINGEVALGASWNIPLTGNLPPINVRVLDSLMIPLADASTSSFTIATANSLFVTKVTAEVWQQDEVYKVLSGTDSTSTPWTLTGASHAGNPVSTVLSHLTYTFDPPKLSSSSSASSSARRLLSTSSTISAAAITIASNSTNALITTDVLMKSLGIDFVIGRTNVNVMHSNDGMSLGSLLVPSITLDSSSTSPIALGASIMFAAQDASYLRHTFGSWLNGRSDLPIHAQGTLSSATYGPGIIDIRYNVPDFPIGLNTSSSPSSSSSSNSSSDVYVLGVYPLGTGTAGETIIVPCLRTGLFCPYDSSQLTATSIEAAIDVHIPDLPFPITVRYYMNSVNFPFTFLCIHFVVPNSMTPLTVDIKCCVYSPLATVTVNSVMVDGQLLRIVVKLIPVDLPLLQQAFLDVADSLSDVTIRVGTSTSTDLLSSILAGIPFVVRILSTWRAKCSLMVCDWNRCGR